MDRKKHEGKTFEAAAAAAEPAGESPVAAASVAPTVKPHEAKPQKASGPLIYAGPTIGKGKLRGHTVFSEGVPPYLSKLIESLPDIKALIVPVDQLAATRQRIAQNGSYENIIFEKLKGEKL